MRSTVKDQRTRTIYGRVTGAAAITLGSADFTVVKQATGAYTIRWVGPGFKGTPTVVAMAEWPAAALATAEDFADSIVARTYNAAGAPADVNFTFIATGAV